MGENKKPDQVVYDEESKKYTAALMPYATNIGAPVITTGDTIAWKNRNIHKVNTQINTKYLELKAEYDAMMAQFEYNKLVYSAKFNFEPLSGETYHLYRNKNKEPFLSVISPEECNFDFVGSFRLKADQMWEKIESANSQ